MFNPFAVVHHKQYERLFTHGLIHADTMHLLFNMLAFYFFAFYLEAFYLGHWQFAVLYVLSIPPEFSHHADQVQRFFWLQFFGSFRSGKCCSAVVHHV